MKNERKLASSGFLYSELEFDSWTEMKAHFLNWRENYRYGTSYAFRGHSDSSWSLKPSLERIRPKIEENIFLNWYRKAEQLSVDRFKRAIHLYSNTKHLAPSDLSILDWLSTMQHYGAATRLLDVTFSPFIGAFFSISAIPMEITKIAIWAIPLERIDLINIKTLGLVSDDPAQEVYDHYQKLEIGLKDGTPIIGYSFLERPNERAFHQKGGFLYSMTSLEGFETTLKKYFQDEESGLIQFTLQIGSRGVLNDIINDLSMLNISFGSLFPGVEGYSRETFMYQYIVNT